MLSFNTIQEVIGCSYVSYKFEPGSSLASEVTILTTSLWISLRCAGFPYTAKYHNFDNY